MDLTETARRYRRQLFEKFVQVGQGHPGSTFSIVEIVTTLFHGGHVRPGFDKVIISKGHATVALYPILVHYGILPQEEWDNWGTGESCLRVFGNTSIPGIDATTGSLGHGLGIAAGMAYAAKKAGSDKKFYVILSEGELYEGSTWEAFLFIDHYNLKNITMIIDINNLMILGKTDDCLQLNPIGQRLAGFNFTTFNVAGHNTHDIHAKLNIVNAEPKLLLAHTVKGKGFSIMENQANWHYMNPLTPEEITQCRREIA
jgi:transketolase